MLLMMPPALSSSGPMLKSAAHNHGPSSPTTNSTTFQSVKRLPGPSPILVLEVAAHHREASFDQARDEACNTA
eukprot:10903905-Lingulodinium_polyedra.AAC.1